MNTKFSIGDKVAVIGVIVGIEIKDQERYDVSVRTDGFMECLTLTHDQLFPASDLTLEEDDLK